MDRMLARVTALIHRAATAIEVPAVPRQEPGSERGDRLPPPSPTVVP
jgi:hypothetical protein